jgi:hypothetical protein
MSETTAEAGTQQVAPPRPHPACGPVRNVCCPIQFPPRPAGKFCVDEVHDNNDAPATILEAKDPFTVTGRIEVTAGNALTGTATVTIYADQLGGDVDKSIGSVAVNIPGDGSFPWSVTVPGGTLDDAPAGGSNLYRLAAVFTMVNSNQVLTETSSFVDLGTYRIS